MFRANYDILVSTRIDQGAKNKLDELALKKQKKLGELLRDIIISSLDAEFSNQVQVEKEANPENFDDKCFDCGIRKATFEGRCSSCNDMVIAVEEAEQLHHERWLNGEE